jgi:hypothetical protein
VKTSLCRTTVVLLTALLWLSGCYDDIDIGALCHPDDTECAQRDFDGDGVANGEDDFPVDEACATRNDDNCTGCGEGCEGTAICDGVGACMCTNERASLPDCLSCIAPFGGSNCNQCEDPRFAAPDCTSCAPGYTGPGCASCEDPNFTGAFCDSCTNPSFSLPDCSGIWVDSTTGLTWENPASTGEYYWDEAIAYCQQLSLDGGGWKLPTISELRSLVRGCAGTMTGGGCNVADGECVSNSCMVDAGAVASCNGCTAESGLGPNGCYWPSDVTGPCGVGESYYWSSTIVTDSGWFENPWFLRFREGKVGHGYNHSPGPGRFNAAQLQVRCVK